MNYNITIVIFDNGNNLDKLVFIKNITETYLAQRFGKEVVYSTKLYKSKQFDNNTVRIFVNVPERTIQLREAKADASEG